MRDALKRLFLQAQQLLERDEFSGALLVYQRALEQATKNHGEEYIALSYLGMLYDDVDASEQAVDYFRQCQQLAKKIYGVESVEYAVSLSNEGMISCNRNRLKVSEPLLDQAVQILLASRKPQSAELDECFRGSAIEVYSNAADCKAKLGKGAESVELLQRAYRVAKSTFSVSEPRRIQAALEFGAMMSACGRRSEANAVTEEVMKGFARMGASPLAVADAVAQAVTNACAMLSGIEKAQGRSTKAADKSASSNNGKQARTGKPVGKGKRTTPDNNAVSNVVSLFPTDQKISELSSDCCGYQLKIVLKRVKPPIWRRVVVPADLKLGELHRFLQEAMGWSNSHLHAFRVGRSSFSNPNEVPDAKDERRYSLSDFGLLVGSKFDYEYDFGDGWEHSIEVEKLLNKAEFEDSLPYLAGRGACPPEDCGGPYGFMHLLQALELEKGRENLPEWLEEYDPQELPDGFPPVRKSVARPSAKKLPAPSLK